MIKKLLLLPLVILFFAFNSMILSQKPSLNQLRKTQLELYKDYTKFNINNISTWIYNNGNTDIQPDGNSGFEFPKGSEKYSVFESGLVFGGIVNGKKLVGGSTYEQGLRPGRILEDGAPQDPADPSSRIYRVRPDYTFADLSTEISDEGKSFQEVYGQYEKDWNEWPGNYGAPYTDVDMNGSYDPSIDIPGITSAHQTIWYVANDFDSVYSNRLYGSTPLYIEFQVTIWGYDIPQTIYENVMFKKYKVINKNDFDISSMYISQWADPDIGDAGDDYVGCDTLLNLAFCYNGDNDDGTYLSTPPAVGYQLIQGPIVKGIETDRAFFNGRTVSGYKNLNMTSHFFFIGSDPVYNDPDLGEYITGTLQYFNLFEGLITTTGTPFLNPITGHSVVFTLDGDPLTGEGWVDGILHPPGDRRHGFVSGPFDLAVGDTQEVVITQFAAIGTDRLNSVKLLKENAKTLQNGYETIYNKYPSEIFYSINTNSIKANLIQDKFSAFDIIELQIDRNDTLESFNSEGFAFQGYNIYQFSQETEFSSAGQRIFTFDKIDEITTISGNKFDPWLNEISEEILINGTNSGLPNYVVIEKDYILDSDLIKGKKYYYGIAPYFYNNLQNKVIEGRLSLTNVIFQEDLQGASYLDSIAVIRNDEKNTSAFNIKVVDPYKLTGDTYEITFREQHYYLDSDGEWKKTNYPDSIGISLSKPNDQSPSKIIPLPSIYSLNNTLDLHFKYENNAPDANYADGIKLTFPESIKINNAEYAGNNHWYRPEINQNTVVWGNQSITSDGGFTGGEELTVNINYAEPTFTVDYEIYDDGWSEYYMDATDDATYYNLGNGTVNGSGTITLTGEIGYQFKTLQLWDLWDIATNQQKLEEIEVKYYSSRYGIRNQNPEYFVDGFKVRLSSSFEVPTNFENIEIESAAGTILSSNYGDPFTAIVIANYTVFGGTISSHAFDNFGVGTTDVNQLQQDYELRFTGVFDQGTTINNKTVYKVKSDGQMATVFRMVNADALANHPLNPKSGTAEPFLIRIPFEVWNVEDPNNPYQINFTFRDRQRDGTEDPFWSWNLDERMYGIIVNSPYDSNQIIQIDDGPDPYNALATWVLIFRRTNYNTGDIIKINYPNPLQLTDKFSFTVPEAPTEKINPNRYEVFQNYPNPFNPNTRIRYFIPEDGLVNLSIYNILGQKITTLVNKEMKAGKYETEFNGSNFASGVYIYRIEAGKFTETKKMLLLK